MIEISLETLRNIKVIACPNVSPVNDKDVDWKCKRSGKKTHEYKNFTKRFKF